MRDEIEVFTTEYFVDEIVRDFKSDKPKMVDLLICVKNYKFGM